MGRTIFFSIILLLNILVVAKDPPPAPTDHKWVQDEANILSVEQEKYLLYKLKAYEDSTSTEIAVVTELTLEGDDIQRYSEELAMKWEIGKKGKDNGVLIYIVTEPENPQARGIFIQVGYGLEATITDYHAHKIIRNIMAPKFKEERYGDGINDAVDAIIGLAAGEFVFDDEKTKKRIPLWIIFFIIIVIVIFFSKHNNGGTSYRGRRSGGAMWTSGGWGSSGGGFGGGGFGGGFGGGGFGGGGAGGSW